MAITTEDVLSFLVSRAQAPSSMGAQLDRLKYGVAPTPDPFRARDEAEMAMLETALLLRCIDAFADLKDLPTSRNVSRPLHKVSKYVRLTDQGALALGILRAYQEWRTHSESRALAAVYGYLSSLSVDLAPTENLVELAQAFREGKARRAMNLVAEAYADSLLSLQRFLITWNRAQIKNATDQGIDAR